VRAGRKCTAKRDRNSARILILARSRTNAAATGGKRKRARRFQIHPGRGVTWGPQCILKFKGIQTRKGRGKGDLEEGSEKKSTGSELPAEHAGTLALHHKVPITATVNPPGLNHLNSGKGKEKKKGTGEKRLGAEQGKGRGDGLHRPFLRKEIRTQKQKHEKSDNSYKPSVPARETPGQAKGACEGTRSERGGGFDVSRPRGKVCDYQSPWPLVPLRI